jgi:tRNA-splicing ligase RtcB (3'-phosphate/5'-hydroxy nucleic acid ligase)
MSNQKIIGKDLNRIGYANDVSRSTAIITASKHFKHNKKEDILNLFQQVMKSPEEYLEDERLKQLAETFIVKSKVKDFTSYSLLEEQGVLKVYGGKEIESEAKRQMEIAMSLPISLQGALMPDAHTGYGLPIGGVLATNNAVIPYGVGVDIGCRMALSIFDLPENFLRQYHYQLKVSLKEYTHFGMEGALEFKQEHEVLDRPEFSQTSLLKKLHGKAARQLGSSGGGNHFVEFGVIELYENNALNISPGKYVSLLSHSGSRGLGATIAQHYTQIAMETCKLPKHAQQLAWLDLNTEAGQEYWLSMNLAGQYAQACHDRIHYNLSKALGIKAIAKVENHHNFAWKEKDEAGNEMIVHRKGATPAHEGELGIIPGSMTQAGYLIIGKGMANSLYSASHGAGRRLSRKKAKENITVSAFKKMIESAGVTLLGGSPEESPLAYKDLETVMMAQEDLVEIQGKFIPRIVRMNKE